MDTIGVRIQDLKFAKQVVALARIAQARSDSGRFPLAELTGLFDDSGLPKPGNPSEVVSSLVRNGLLTALGPKSVRTYRLTPEGMAQSVDLATDMDLQAFLAEVKVDAGMTVLGATGHPVIPPHLAPPDLVQPLHKFFERHPFETNVFGMTRFPDANETKGPDPVGPALDVARDICAQHGLTFHLASDRQIVDDLWSNVAAHLWACKYAIAFFEDRRDRGINYNLSIEVGSAMVLGRRIAILKDRSIDTGQSIERLPSDLTGKIYKPIDLDDPATVRKALNTWIVGDLAL